MAFLGVLVPNNISSLLSKIDVPGEKTPINEFHITLLYFGNDWDIDLASKSLPIIHEIVSEIKPFTIEANLITTFPGSEDGVPIIMPIKSKELTNLYDKLSKHMDKAKIDFSKKFKFCPHITLSYSKEKIDDRKIDTVSFMVDGLKLWCGDYQKDNLNINFNMGLKDKHALINLRSDLFYKFASK